MEEGFDVEAEMTSEEIVPRLAFQGGERNVGSFFVGLMVNQKTLFFQEKYGGDFLLERDHLDFDDFDLVRQLL